MEKVKQKQGLTKYSSEVVKGNEMHRCHLVMVIGVGAASVGGSLCH